jgi:tRNA threonylcarbamoyladenosine biosynthesis protein TsaB
VPLLLHIETATDVCSVCLARDGVLSGIEESHEKNSHAALLHVLIKSLLKKNHIKYSDLEGIAVSMGPGSYTGLRIGVAAAKGFCFSMGIPLIAINSLQAMTAWFIETQKIDAFKKEEILFCPMIDARRMEVYTALFNPELSFIEPAKAVVLDSNSFDEIFLQKKILFFGTGSDKFRDLIPDQNRAFFFRNFSTSSAGMPGLANTAYEAREFRNLTMFEPFYLKDFLTLPSRK